MDHENELSTEHSASLHGDAPAEGMNALLHSADTWILLSFIIFVALFSKYVLPMMLKGLDARGNAIRDQLEQASRLRAEAQALLKTYQEQQTSALAEAEEIVARAGRDAAEIREQAARELEQTLERRTQQAQEKIERATAEAITHIRARMITAATESAKEMLAAQTVGAQADASIAQAIAAIDTLH